MISIAQSCLLFELASGESIPFSAEMISVEVMGESAGKFDPEVIRHAAAAVFHYFKHELERQTVTVGEFAEQLETVLRGLGFSVRPVEADAPADLRVLARESGEVRELVFFPRLRDEVRTQLQSSPRLVRFRGLRGCVKHLAGARRWSPRCQNLHDQIVGYLRECFRAETHEAGSTLVVE